ncbi:hypothetical protein ACFYKT_18165 [Cytobacillus sp. FJAT-53684]|uniref:DUF2325 domain-containing protein n=1 Tax=Cytobacillus mangrovibacter TaxID=3299024 RepID=A0ABW6K289_9BACI
MKNFQQNKKELEALRTFVNHQNIEAGSDNCSFEERVLFLKEKNIVIIGGHPNWQIKLKEIFPNYIIVDVENLNRDLSFIGHADAVFINTNFLSHSLYWKVMNQMSKNEVPLHFMERTTNIERIVMHLYEMLNPVVTSYRSV